MSSLLHICPNNPKFLRSLHRCVVGDIFDHRDNHNIVTQHEHLHGDLEAPHKAMDHQLGLYLRRRYNNSPKVHRARPNFNFRSESTPDLPIYSRSNSRTKISSQEVFILASHKHIIGFEFSSNGLDFAHLK